jgi:hypothetical protein
MFPRLTVVVCALSFAFGCAAEQIDDAPGDPGSGNSTSTAGKTSSNAGSGGMPSAGGTSGLPLAGTTSAGGNGSAGTGTAGKGSAGSAGTGAGGGSGSGTSGSASGGSTSVSNKLPFTEDFEDGAADGFVPWNDKMMAGAWEVVADGASKVYRPTAAVSELELAVGGSTTWTDVAFSTKVKLGDANSDAQIVLRFKDPKTYLVVEMADGKFKLRGRAAGSTKDLIAPSPKPEIVAGTWYKVGLVAKGTTISLTLDDKPIGSPAMCDATISNGGIALGAAEGSVSFDDVSVTAAP